MNSKERGRQARSRRWGKAVVEKSGEDVVRADGMRMARGNAGGVIPNLRIGRRMIVGPMGVRDRAPWRPHGFGRV
jgi:hypothetical protein